MSRCLRLTLGILAAASAAPAAAQVSLAPKYVAGETTKLTDHVRFDQTLTVLAQPQKIGADTTFVIDVVNGPPGSDGSVAVASTFRSIVNELRLPTGGAIRYDSANPAANTSTDPHIQALMDVFHALLDRTITHRIDAQGKVIAVEGIREIVRRAPEAAAKALEQELTVDKFKRDVQQELDALPRDPVNVGDSWTRTEVLNLGAGQSLSFDRRYQYVGEAEEGGRKLDHVTIQDEKVVYATPPQWRVKSSELKVDSSEGALWIDRQRGYVVRREVNSKASGSLVLDIMGMEVPAELVLTIEQRRVVTQ